jgi:protein-disulfide isomerase
METQKRIIIWISVMLVVGITTIAVWQIATAAPKIPLPPKSAPGILAEPVSANEWTKGTKDAKVSIVEYSDFQCPACGAFYPTIEKITAEYKNKISFTYRHFPLPQHKNAERTAYAAEAAGKQGKFWEMYALIFEHQNDWSDVGASQAEKILLDYAQNLKLDIDLFKKDMRSTGTRDRVKRDRDVGVRSGVNSTPTFYVNGNKIQNPRGYEELKVIIDKELVK